MPVPLVSVHPANVQGIIAHTYPCPLSRHLLFQFTSAAGARQFIRALLPITTAADGDGNNLTQARNLALTFHGLTATQVLSAEALQQFSPEFRNGPNPSTLFDVGSSANWWNGVPGTALHCLVVLYAQSDAELDSQRDQVLAVATATGTQHQIVRPQGATIDGRALSVPRRVHFGYLDGFSVPQLAWNDPAQDAHVDFRHFLLGYSTPSIESSPRNFGQAGGAEAVAFARDGSYGVLRVMHQNVAAFNQFVADNAARLAPALGMSEPEAASWLADKMLGRRKDGVPLAPDQNGQAVTADAAFDYTGDRQGQHCPFAAHIRVVNPRPDQAIKEIHEPVPRIIRRGMPYGKELTGTTDDGEERGLIGLFLCSSLREQFQKLLDWINHTNFSPVFSDLRGQDPLLGNRDLPLAATNFVIPTPNGPLEATGLKTFVETRGTAYLLFPSLNALRQIADAV